MMMSARAAFEPVEAALRRDAWSTARREPPRMTPARKRALEIAADGADPRQSRRLPREADCSTGVIDGLVAAGTLVEVAIPEKRLPRPIRRHRATEFIDEQARAVHAHARRPSTAAISP